MESAHCPEHSAHDQMITSHEQRLNEAATERKQMEVMMQRLIDLSEYAQKRIDQHATDLKRHEERINALEEKPMEDAQKVKNAVLGSIGGALGTGLVGIVVFALSKSIS